MQQPPLSKRFARLRGLLGWIGALAFSLVVTEAFLRVAGLPSDQQEFLSVEFDSGTFVADAKRFWRLSEECATYEVNAVGLRGWWPARPKLAGEYRILCVGDSCTFGHGVCYEDTYGVRLERLVQTALPDNAVRTVLAALPGYSTHQSRVLLDLYAADLRPDVTVLYCGGWNDYVPAIRHSDADWALRRSGGVASLRLAALLQRLGTDAAQAPTDRESLQQAFREGKPPYGRRVPLVDYRDNLTHLIEVCRQVGSEVVVVIPPLPNATLENFPIALEYRDVTRTVAAATGVSLLDAATRFAEFDAACPGPWKSRPSGDPVCFRDWAHPSALGHELLAKSLFEHMRPSLEARRESRPYPISSELPVIESITPARVSSLQGGTVVLHGRGFDEAAVTERVWVGRHWIRDLHRIDDSKLRLTLPGSMEAGTQAVVVSTLAGPVVAPVSLVVEPVDVRVKIERRDDGLELDVVLCGPPGWSAGVWLSPGLRDRPAATFGGDFWLAAEPDGRPVGRDDLPFRFDRLQIPGFVGRLDEGGVWHLNRQVFKGASEIPSKIYVQAGIQKEGVDCIGSMSRVVEIEIPN